MMSGDGTRRRIKSRFRCSVSFQSVYKNMCFDHKPKIFEFVLHDSIGIGLRRLRSLDVDLNNAVIPETERPLMKLRASQFIDICIFNMFFASFP